MIGSLGQPDSVRALKLGEQAGPQCRAGTSGEEAEVADAGDTRIGGREAQVR